MALVELLPSSLGSSPASSRSGSLHRPTSSVSITLGVTLDDQSTHVPTPVQHIFCATLIIPLGEVLFILFLNFLRDRRRNCQLLIWILSDFSRSLVDIKTEIRLRQNKYTEFYAVVQHFIARDDESVLFQVKLVRWNTAWGWHAPNEEGQLVAYVLVPLENCTARYQDPNRFAYFKAPTSLINYMYTIAERVAAANTKEEVLRLPNNPVTNALHKSFVMEPDLKYFYRGQSTGVAMTEEDHRTTVKSDLGPIPPDFNPQASYAPYLLRFTKFELGAALRASQAPGIPLSQPICFGSTPALQST
ncbi:unnamed protein product [Peniophora sp. CBMAI 1063]|nr:unnamed protein product [Peniophora sp. CBMAI 1063]